MNIKKNRLISAAGFVFLSVIFVFLRLRVLDHQLVWDEAWNILSLRAFLSGAVESPFYWYYFFHPPLYMFFARYLYPFLPDTALRLGGLSLFFSYITFSIVYLFSGKLGGRKYARYSCFFLALLPASISYDTWIKRDSLAICLGYAALYSIYKRRYVPAAFLMGLSLLSKETAAFFILAGSIIFIFSQEKNKLKVILSSAVIVLILNAWWYIHLSTFSENLFSYYFSKDTVSSIARSSDIFYYFKKLLIDCGIVNLLFFFIGSLYSGYLLFRKKQRRWIYPLAVFACVYLSLSFIVTSKAPWQTMAAIPAIAMISASGLVFLLRVSKKIKFLRLIVFTALFISLLTALNFSNDQFNSVSYPSGWPGAKVSGNLAAYLNNNMLPDDKLLISDFSYWNESLCPVFLYYWKGKDLILLQEKDIENTGFIEESLRTLDINWLVIPFSPDKDTKRHAAARDISARIKKQPLRLGWAYIWDLR